MARSLFPPMPIGPSSGCRANSLSFKDGVDDFCYLEIDGHVLMNDNDWTGNSSVDNGGGHVAVFDVSHAKYNDGEWVPFRMVTWEGTGGDTASLYWNAFDTNGSFARCRSSAAGTAGNYTPTLGPRGQPEGPQRHGTSRSRCLRQTSGCTDGVTPGLTADIYFHGNDGNFTALDNCVTGNPPTGTTILPRVHWSSPGRRSWLPTQMAWAGDLFTDAIPGFSNTGDGQEDYGVNLTGQIFIPSDAARTTLNAPGGNNLIAFEDGVDDFCYLEIDGTVLINDNDWTGNSSVDNGGGNISLFDASAAKFDDGEWVPFRMMTWEGGGGDTASLYWSALDTNNTITGAQLPSRLVADRTFSGIGQIGSHTTTAPFPGVSLPAGSWTVEMIAENTGTRLPSSPPRLSPQWRRPRRRSPLSLTIPPPASSTSPLPHRPDPTTPSNTPSGSSQLARRHPPRSGTPCQAHASIPAPPAPPRSRRWIQTRWSRRADNYLTIVKSTSACAGFSIAGSAARRPIA